ncbi:MAG: Rho termination factor N-terminal domain-containing protein, partial [Actinomycetes bacterium]
MSDTTTVLDAPAEGVSGDTSATPAKRKRAAGLSGMVLAELQSLAGELGISGTGRMRKGQLIEAIKERQGGGEQAVPRERAAPREQAAPQSATQTTRGGDAADAGRSETAQAPTSPPVGDAGHGTTDDRGPDGRGSQRRERQRDRQQGDRQQGERPQGDRPQGDRHQGDRQQADRQQADRQQAERQQGEDRGQQGDRQQGDRQQADRYSQNDAERQQDRQNEGGRDRQRDGGGQRDRQQGNRPQGNQQRPQGQSGPRDDEDDDFGDGRGRRRRGRYRDRNRSRRGREGFAPGEAEPEISEDDVLVPVAGILDILDNYAFVRTSGYLPGHNDVYVSLAQVRKSGLRKGDAVTGAVRQPREGERKEKFNALVRL